MNDRAVEAQRGDETRQRLIQAGLRLFGRHTYAGVRTRALAEAARTNQAAIPYHFKGKEGVYLAVAHHIVETFGADLRRRTEEIRSEASQGSCSRATAGVLLRRLLVGFAELIITSSEATDCVHFILHEQLRPTAAYDLFHEGFIRQFHETASALVGRLTGRAADDPDTIIRTHALLGQVLAFGISRETVLRRLGWQDFTPQRVERVGQISADLACRAVGLTGGTGRTTAVKSRRAG